MPYIGRAPSASITKLEDADQDTKIQVEESSDEDIIRFDIAGAEDFRMAANSFNVLSGSTLTIDSGATITNSGTSNNFGTDMESAYAGVLQTNANFVDQVIFGPSVDGVPWKGLWNKASVFSSLMLATIEDEGSNTEINIWDLTEQSAGAISTTPLATVDLSDAATPTSIAASMGYLIVGSEDGIAIIDPHSGAWAERTQGWPRRLSSGTTPALTNNDVEAVAAGFANQPPLDPRTGGPMPCFGVAYGTGSDVASLIKDDGNVWDMLAGTVSAGEGAVAFGNGHLFFLRNGLLQFGAEINTLSANDGDAATFFAPAAASQGFGAGNGASIVGNMVASADPDGLSMGIIGSLPSSGGSTESLTAIVTRAYSSGYLTRDIRGAWLSNSNTVDRSYKANTLTNNGTVPTATIGELTVYGPFSTSNYLSRASDADWDVLGTGNVYMSCWFETSGATTSECLMSFSNAAGSIRCSMTFEDASTDNIMWEIQGATATGSMSGDIDHLADSKWHKCDLVQVSSTERYIYIDGVLDSSSTTDIGSLSSSGNLPFAIGRVGGSSIQPGASVQLALAHLSATAPTATQVRQMYEAEKGMFVASSECLLQSGSTDAVLDVDVDPLTGKVIVTQTDAITIFDGLVVDSKPSVNSGNSEKGKLWGALRAEQNSANAYVTAPAVDQRQVNEMVRGLASELPAGVDLSKAKAWCAANQSTGAILSSFNVKSVSDAGTGLLQVNWGIPFKSANYVVVSDCDTDSNAFSAIKYASHTTTGTRVVCKNTSASETDENYVTVVAYGELENE